LLAPVISVQVLNTGCATLTADSATPGEASFPKAITYVGAYDSRMQTGGVDTKRIQTDYGYSNGGLYSNTYELRTGEVEPNLMIKEVSKGFVAAGKSTVKDASGDSPLEARSEMGMEWLARNRATERYIVSVEIKDARVNLEGAQANYTLGFTAMTLGVLSPLLLCTTAPCLLYPLVSKTQADAVATGVVRVYDRDKGQVVHRADITATATTSAQGFHDPEAVFALLANEVALRLGEKAAVAAAIGGY
jgi:hypothetical protein